MNNLRVIVAVVSALYLAFNLLQCSSVSQNESTSSAQNPATHSPSYHTPSMKGVCWVAGDSVAEHNIIEISEIGVNYISQTPFGWMEGHQNPVVHGNFDRAWWGETDKGITETSELARAKGIKSMLKPHIWLHASNGSWRSDIAMKSEEEWTQWFDSYESWILHYAQLAEDAEIESLCIGTELHQTIKRTDDWRHIIAEIRKIYHGEITYAANWYQEYNDVKFWDDLDFIGIQGYFPLSKKDNPTKKDLLDGWAKHVGDLESLAKAENKKIVFTEIGYKNTSDSAKEPWVWPRAIDSTVIRSDDLQKICYEALFEAFWDKPWFDGIFLWKWFHSTHKFEDYSKYKVYRDSVRAERAKRRNRPISRNQIQFSPQGLEAMDVVAEWYLNR
ncbi:hypothetical protein N9L92_01860 [Saprospiraceae bacterium]|nr:hypothetical protein [Saprospiraceae bacterium]